MKIETPECGLGFIFKNSWSEIVSILASVKCTRNSVWPIDNRTWFPFANAFGSQIYVKNTSDFPVKETDFTSRPPRFLRLIDVDRGSTTLLCLIGVSDRDFRKSATFSRSFSFVFNGCCRSKVSIWSRCSFKSNFLSLTELQLELMI